MQKDEKAKRQQSLHFPTKLMLACNQAHIGLQKRLFHEVTWALLQANSDHMVYPLNINDLQRKQEESARVNDYYNDKHSAELPSPIIHTQKKGSYDIGVI